MVRRRADACWKMLTEAEHTVMADIAAVFFEDVRERYYMHVGDPPAPDDSSDLRFDQAPSPAVTKVFKMAAQRRDPAHTRDASNRPFGE